jgi:hypothetical protein
MVPTKLERSQVKKEIAIDLRKALAAEHAKS